MLSKHHRTPTAGTASCWEHAQHDIGRYYSIHAYFPYLKAIQSVLESRTHSQHPVALPDAEPLANSVYRYSGFLKYRSVLREIFPCLNLWKEATRLMVKLHGFQENKEISWLLHFGYYILRISQILPQVEARLVTCFLWHRLSSLKAQR